MKKIVVLVLALLWSSIAVGAVSLRVCEADGNTPFDSNTPIMVGAKLTIYIDSNSAAADWVGGVDLLKPDPEPNIPIGKLFGRGWDPNALDYVDSRFSAAGIRAKSVDWENQVQQSFELAAGDANMATGTWFVLDYNVMGVGDYTIELVEFQGDQIVVVASKTIQQVATRDFNGDGYVDFVDFARLASYWLRTDCNGLNHCEGTDLNPDGKIDFFDVMYFAQYWLGQSHQTETYLAGGDQQQLQMESFAGSFDALTMELLEDEQQMMMDSNTPAIYLVYDGNMTPDPNTEVTVYVYSDTPLFSMDVYARVVGNANITTAMDSYDCVGYGWDDDWGWDPYIDEPNGVVDFGGISWNATAIGTVGYFTFVYHSGEVSVSIDTANSMALGWDGETCPEVPFSTDVLVFGRDPNEL